MTEEKTLTNPYTERKMIPIGSDMFFGREKEKRMKSLTSFVIIFLIIVWNGPLDIFAQTSELPSDQRGVRILAKDNQTGQEKIVNLYKKVYGVIIGIDRYQNLSPNQQLRYAVKDAKGIEKILKERFVFDEIITLYDREASREAIMSTLLGKMSQTTTDDAVFIFFAGHGHTGTSQYGELGFLVPYDGSFEKTELYKNISMTQLKEDVGKSIPAKHVFFMIDACYSGLLVTRGSVPETKRDLKYMQKITKETVRQVLTAGGQDETVLDGGPLGHSVFLGRILQILNDTSDYITASELSVTVKEKVFSDSNAMGHIQTPAFGTFWGLGDFVFIPRVDRRYEEVQTEISKLQSQLTEIEAQKKEAAKLKSEKEIREDKRKEEDLRVKLKASQLEQERLQKEKERKVLFEAEEKKLAAEEAQKKVDLENKKRFGEEELEKLRQKFVDEQIKLKDIKQEVLFVDSARKEIAQLEEKIEGIKSAIYTEKEKAFAQSKLYYNTLIEKLKGTTIPPKDQFETTSDYEGKLKAHYEKIQQTMEKYEKEDLDLSKKYEDECESLMKPYKEQIEIIRNIKYPVEGLTIELLSYNPDTKNYATIVMDSQAKKRYYSLLVSPDIAKGMYSRKELLKVEGYFKDLYDLRMGEVFVIDPIAGKFKLSLCTPTLRTNYLNIGLSIDDAMQMLKEKGLLNILMIQDISQADAASQLEQLTINGDIVIADFSTGLMWHQSGSPRLKTDLLHTYHRKVETWLNKLNQTGYAGYKDWRYPNLEEAASLVRPHNSASGLYINPLFSPTQYIMWTGDMKGNYLFWLIDLRTARLSLSDYIEDGVKKETPSYLRPVRFIIGSNNE